MDPKRCQSEGEGEETNKEKATCKLRRPSKPSTRLSATTGSRDKKRRKDMINVFLEKNRLFTPKYRNNCSTQRNHAGAARNSSTRIHAHHHIHNLGRARLVDPKRSKMNVIRYYLLLRTESISDLLVRPNRSGF